MTAPVWGIKHTQAASGGSYSAWGYAEGKSDIGVEIRDAKDPGSSVGHIHDTARST